MSKISREDLLVMIQNTEAAGRDASELKAALASLPQQGQSNKARGQLGEEQEITTADHLQQRVGDLFTGGVTDDVLAQLIKIDGEYSLKDLRKMCKDAGLGTGGDKKVLAAKLLASGSLNREEAQMQQEAKTNFRQQREWSGKPGTLTIPEEYIKGLKFEVIVFARKERGGSDFSFQCKYYDCVAGREYKFAHVLIDTSRKNPQGEVVEARLTYHPQVCLVNVGFMVVPVAEE